MDLSQSYLSYADDNLRHDLEKMKLFGAVVEDGATVADADAADSVIVKCKVVDFSKGHVITPSTGHVQITFSRQSDHTVLQHILTKVAWGSQYNDEYKGRFTSAQGAHEIKKVLK